MVGNTDIMTEQRRSHDDKRYVKLLLSQRLDRVSIQHIKMLGNKLKSIDDAVTINKK